MTGWFILLLSMLAAGGIAGIIVKLTVAIIKKFRKKRHTKVIAAQMSTIAKEAAKNPKTKHVKFDDLENYDTALLEYDPNSDNIIQTKFCEDVDDVVRYHQQQGGGVVVYED